MLKTLLMPPSLRLLAGLVPPMLLFLASPAFGQQDPPDALEQPYGAPEPSVRPTATPADSAPPTPSVTTPKAPSAPPAAASVPPAAANPAPAVVSGVVYDFPPVDTRPQGPIRAQRRLALTGEVGWNGIAGFGPVLGYHVDPHFTVELGVGISFTGFKGGIRGRYNFATGPVTPFVGAGFMATGGLGVVSGPTSDDASQEVTIRVHPSQFVQMVGGIDWTSKGGFTLVGTFGWCSLLNHNLDIIAGMPTQDDRDAFDVIFKSGPVITVATGYTFK